MEKLVYRLSVFGSVESAGGTARSVAKKMPVAVASGNNQEPSAQRRWLGLVQMLFWSDKRFFKNGTPRLFVFSVVDPLVSSDFFCAESFFESLSLASVACAAEESLPCCCGGFAKPLKERVPPAINNQQVSL